MKFVSPGVRGRPDRIIVLDGKTAFVETKRPKGGKLSQQQKDNIELIQNAGGKVFVIWSHADVDNLMNIWSLHY